MGWKGREGRWKGREGEDRGDNGMEGQGSGSTVIQITLQVKGRLQKMGALSSMNIFLRQELDRMQKVIMVVRGTLQDLQLAIEGTIIMSEVGVVGRH